MYLTASGRRPARREGVTPGGTADQPGFGHGRYTAQTALPGTASAAVPAAPFARAARYAALAVTSALVPGSSAASGAGAAGASR
jgi:hypothetical protein